MATKNRSDLKSYFVKNAIPTEGNFADLVDSQLNQAQDGVFKPDGEALSVVAAPGDQKRVLRLYASYPAASPDWMISLHPAQDPANAATTGKTGFGITDGAGNTRLFIDAATGQIGVGTNTPQVALDVVGVAQANGFRGQYDMILNDFRTVNPESNVCLQSPPGDRDAWIYRDTAVGSTTSNYGIYHRQIDTPVGNLPGNSIGFVGNTALKAYIALGDGSAWFAGPVTLGGALAVGGALTVSGGFSLRQNSASGTEVFTVDGAAGNLTINGNLTMRKRLLMLGTTDGSRASTNELVGGIAFQGAGISHGELAFRAGRGFELVHTNSDGGRVPYNIGDYPYAPIWCGVVTATNFVNSSDLRMKRDVETVTGALQKVLQLRAVSFRWRNGAADLDDTDEKVIGMIAQEVQTVIPGAVSAVNGDELGLSYPSITALLVGAIKDQNVRINTLEQRLAGREGQS